MRLAVVYPDAERLTRDLLEALVVTIPVGIGVPPEWEGEDYLQVSLDGTPVVEHPIVARATVRIVGWASTTTRAKELANLALGLLCAHDGGDGISDITPLTGVLPARDPDNRGEIASVTVRVSTRSSAL